MAKNNVWFDADLCCKIIFTVYKNSNTNEYFMIYRQFKTAAMAAFACQENGFNKQIYFSASAESAQLARNIRRNFPRELGHVKKNIIKLADGATENDLLSYFRGGWRGTGASKL